jgi:hypothetical protein
MTVRHSPPKKICGHTVSMVSLETCLHSSNLTIPGPRFLLNPITPASVLIYAGLVAFFQGLSLFFFLPLTQVSLPSSVLWATNCIEIEHSAALMSSQQPEKQVPRNASSRGRLLRPSEKVQAMLGGHISTLLVHTATYMSGRRRGSY